MIEAAAGLAAGLAIGGALFAQKARKLGEKADQEVAARVTALARERQRLQAVLQAMDDAVLAIDADGRLTLLNNSARQLLGLRPEVEVQGSLLRTLGTTTQLTDLVQSLGDQRSASAEFEVEGPPHRAYLARATRQDSSGGAVLVVQEVTRLRKLEKMRKDFVANVSHELRTPVTIIRANAETLMDGAIDDPTTAAQFLGALMRNADRLSNLVSDLLDLSRIESGRLELSFEAVSLRSVAARAIDAVAPHAADKDQQLRLMVSKDLHVNADAGALEQVLVNLLSNASNYTPEGGEVSVHAHSDGHLCRVQVIDNGPGIAAEHHRRVFERFYRVDKGR